VGGWPSTDRYAVLRNRTLDGEDKTVMELLKVCTIACSFLVVSSCTTRTDGSFDKTDKTGASASEPHPASPSAATVRGKAPAPASVVILMPRGSLPDQRPSETPVMDQSGQMFFPDILIARTGYPVTFANTDTDPEFHNIDVKNGDTREQSFNVTIPTGGSYSYTFEHDGLYDVTCDIHPGMYAELVVSSSPYVVVSDAGGTFAIKNVPEGTYTMTVYAGKDTIEKDVNVKAPTTEVRLDSRDGSPTTQPLQ
jgi:plastocyanin